MLWMLGVVAIVVDIVARLSGGPHTEVVTSATLPPPTNPPKKLVITTKVPAEINPLFRALDPNALVNQKYNLKESLGRDTDPDVQLIDLIISEGKPDVDNDLNNNRLEFKEINISTSSKNASPTPPTTTTHKEAESTTTKEPTTTLHGKMG